MFKCCISTFANRQSKWMLNSIPYSFCSILSINRKTNRFTFKIDRFEFCYMLMLHIWNSHISTLHSNTIYIRFIYIYANLCLWLLNNVIACCCSHVWIVPEHSVTLFFSKISIGLFVNGCSNTTSCNDLAPSHMWSIWTILIVNESMVFGTPLTQYFIPINFDSLKPAKFKPL